MPGDYGVSGSTNRASYVEFGVRTVDGSGSLSVAVPGSTVMTIYPHPVTNMPPTVTDFRASLTLPASSFGPCTGQVLPVAEDCNDSKDNDCDGLTDVDDTVDCGVEPDGGDADATADRSGSLNGGCSCRSAGAAGRPWLWLFILAVYMLGRLLGRRSRA